MPGTEHLCFPPNRDHHHQADLLGCKRVRFPACRIWSQLKNYIFWDTTPCSLVKINRRLGRTYRPHLQSRSMKPAWRWRSNSGHSWSIHPIRLYYDNNGMQVEGTPVIKNASGAQTYDLKTRFAEGVIHEASSAYPSVCIRLQFRLY
jgi:hypothetical protein